jgi:hypothetical protein
MSHRVTLILPGLFLILCATLSQAQTSPPKPGPEAQKLAAYVGRWSVEGNLPAGSMGSTGGKTTGTVSCEWVADRFGILCRERVPFPGGDGLSDAYLVAYDALSKAYLFTQISAGGVVWNGRGTVDGDTWVWTVDSSTRDGKPIHLRFTEKFTSPDSIDFKNEYGDSPDQMKGVMMQGKQIRVKASTPKPSQ